MATISVCMIVKNEEALLEECLNSLKGIWDELIIVDTGSTDTTKEIAKKFTDKVYDYEWIDDFSDARNFSIRKATMEYIYVADADELLDKENYERFLQLKENLLPEIEIVQMMYVNQLENGTVYNFDREYRPKLYKRLREFCFIEPVHETVRTKPLVYDSDIEIIHRPASVHAGRDIAIFERLVLRKGALSDRLFRMYSLELLLNGTEENFKFAHDYFENIAQNCEEYEKVKIAGIILSKEAVITKDVTLLLKYALKEIALEGASEVCTLLGEYYESVGDNAEAALWYYNACYETEPELSIIYKGKLPLEGLVRVYTALGDKESADYYTEELKKV